MQEKRKFTSNVYFLYVICTTHMIHPSKVFLVWHSCKKRYGRRRFSFLNDLNKFHRNNNNNTTFDLIFTILNLVPITSASVILLFTK